MNQTNATEPDVIAAFTNGDVSHHAISGKEQNYAKLNVGYMYKCGHRVNATEMGDQQFIHGIIRHCLTNSANVVDPRYFYFTDIVHDSQWMCTRLNDGARGISRFAQAMINGDSFFYGVRGMGTHIGFGSYSGEGNLALTADPERMLVMQHSEDVYRIYAEEHPSDAGRYSVYCVLIAEGLNK